MNARNHTNWNTVLCSFVWVCVCIVVVLVHNVHVCMYTPIKCTKILVKKCNNKYLGEATPFINQNCVRWRQHISRTATTILNPLVHSKSTYLVLLLIWNVVYVRAEMIYIYVNKLMIVNKPKIKGINPSCLLNSQLHSFWMHHFHHYHHDHHDDCGCCCCCCRHYHIDTWISAKHWNFCCWILGNDLIVIFYYR